MLDTSDAEWAQSSEALKRALADLQTAAGTLRDTEERFRALVTATSDVIYRMSPDWSEMWQLQGQGFIADTASVDRKLAERLHPSRRSAARDRGDRGGGEIETPVRARASREARGWLAGLDSLPCGTTAGRRRKHRRVVRRRARCDGAPERGGSASRGRSPQERVSRNACP